jgi:drug/metabolite transporter (DMT)-like permease
MVGVALLWSVAMPLDKIAVQHSSVPFHGFALNLGVAVGALAILVVKGRLGELSAVRQHWRLILLADLVSVVAIGLFLLALAKLWVGIVETLRRGIGSVMAILSGHFFFSEKLRVQSLFAVLLLGLGVALVTW